MAPCIDNHAWGGDTKILHFCLLSFTQLSGKMMHWGPRNTAQCLETIHWNSPLFWVISMHCVHRWFTTAQKLIASLQIEWGKKKKEKKIGRVYTKIKINFTHNNVVWGIRPMSPLPKSSYQSLQKDHSVLLDGCWNKHIIDSLNKIHFQLPYFLGP